jgi:hypothetical protein
LHDVLLFGVLSTSRKSTTTLYRGTSMSHLRLAALCCEGPRVRAQPFLRLVEGKLGM